jgi:hypothetical protein
MRTPTFLLLLAALVTGCATSQPDAPRTDTTPREPIAERDVILDGVSLLGVWNAVGALDEPDVDADLRSGDLTETLIVNPRGRVTLTGEDRDADTGRMRFEGRITGDRIAFDDLPGEGTITVRSDGRIVVTDPRGNRTVYERE